MQPIFCLEVKLSSVCSRRCTKRVRGLSLHTVFLQFTNLARCCGVCENREVQESRWAVF